MITDSSGASNPCGGPSAAPHPTSTRRLNFSIKFMCERLGVTRQGFYAWRTRPPCQRRIVDAAYTAVIKRIHAESRCNYGAPRICAELADDYNIRCGRKRVARLMRRMSR